ncbi:MAG: pyrophosphatase [Alphaproteobacteria bacterium]|nr:pyrophosphatase [Alphaproteobacteria bacterium]
MLNEFADWVATVPKPDLASRTERLAYAGLGLVGEAGEIADTLRRGMRDGSLNEERLVYEVADLLFHWVALCVELGQSPEVMIAQSRANISDRIAGRVVNAFARSHPEEHLRG